MQNFIENFFITLKHLFKIIALSRFRKFPKIQLKYNETVILGNGPSLNNLIEQNQWFLEDKLKICVNFFALSSYYELVKPEIYVLIDPGFFKPEAPQNLKQKRDNLYNKIATVTNWQLFIYMPFEALKFKSAYQQLNENKNVKILYFNNVGIEGFNSFEHLCFNLSLGLPRPRNVIVPSIYISIQLGIKTIYLAGTDHNWINHIFVGNDNKLYMAQNHFYDTTNQKEAIKDWKNQDIKLHEMLQNFVVLFKSYWTLERYSKTKNVKIFNITPISFIDAFERLKIEKDK